MFRRVLENLFLWLVLSCPALPGAAAANLQIPASSEALTIDGTPDEVLWQKAQALPLESTDLGMPFPAGGEARIVMRGKYLCVSARLPEPGPLVAVSVGRNPVWWYEDMVTWRFEDLVRKPGKPNARRFFTLTVNPLGGVRLDEPTLAGGGVPDRGAMVSMVTGDEDAAVWRSNTRFMFAVPVDLVDAAKTPIAAAHMGPNEWSFEAAIPLDPLPELGIMSVERIRARRPEAPELRWYWPKPHLGGGFEFRLSDATEGVPAPAFRPPQIGSQAPAIGIAKLAQLPPLDAAGPDGLWRAATRVELSRDEGMARPPRFPTGVRLAHDGQTLAILARCAQPLESPSSDSLRVILSPSGADFAEFDLTPAGGLRQSLGAVGPVRSISPHAWPSGSATARATRNQQAWTARLNLPLREIAAALGEPRVPEQWRILIQRSWSGHGGQGEESSLPVMQTLSPYAPARYQRVRLLEGKAMVVSRTEPSPRDKLAQEIASIPAEVWSKEERQRLKIDKMVENNLLTYVDDTARKERLAWEKVKTAADWEAFRQRRLQALRDSFGSFPERTPLRAAVTRRANYGDGFVLENIVFESRPNLLVPANLYLPEKIEGRIPAIVLVHNHHEAKTQPENQDMGMIWARQGAAVLVMDMIGGTERPQLNPWPHDIWGFSNYYTRYTTGMQLYLAGETLMKWFVWDLMRGIDVLLERPYIDPARIAILGQCSGGGDAAAVTAALDERIAVMAPDNFCGGTPMEHYRWGTRRYDFETASPGWAEWEPTRGLKGSIAGQFFPWFICASVAPRGFIYNMEVAWPGGVEKQPPWPRFQKVYGLYGKRDLLDQFDGFGPMPGPGETNTGAMLRQGLYPILERWLGISKAGEEYHNPRPYGELMCVTAKIAAERKPKPASEITLEMARERLRAARARYAGVSAEEGRRLLAADLKARLGDIEPDREPKAHSAWAKSGVEFTADGLWLEAEGGIKIPLVLLKPKARLVERVPMVMALAQQGKERFLSDRGNEIAALLRAGVAVCLADVRGVGETADNAPPWYAKAAEASGGHSETHRARNMELAAVEFMLGRTMLGSRLKDARTVFHYLSGRADVDAARIMLWGDSFTETNPRGLRIYEDGEQQMGPQIFWQAEPLGSALAVMTAFYEDGVRGVATRGGLVSFLSVLGDRFCYVPLDIIVPGILEAGDLADMVGRLAPRAVWMEVPVNGRNQALNATEWKEEMKTALTAYARNPEGLVFGGNAREQGLAGWLAEQCRR
jgi:dienelactone hydrolase